MAENLPYVNANLYDCSQSTRNNGHRSFQCHFQESEGERLQEIGKECKNLYDEKFTVAKLEKLRYSWMPPSKRLIYALYFVIS